MGDSDIEVDNGSQIDAETNGDDDDDVNGVEYKDDGDKDPRGIADLDDKADTVAACAIENDVWKDSDNDVDPSDSEELSEFNDDSVVDEP